MTETTKRPHRAAIYLFFDPEGIVDGYVPHMLRALKEHVDHVLVVVNGKLSTDGARLLAAAADDVLVRRNVGFDVWGYKEGLERLGEERVAEFDELILLNYTFFGPVRPLAPVFDDMDSRDVDFWGITDHGAVEPHPHRGFGTMPAHIQSHWIAVKQRMLRSEHWRTYWREMPLIESYEDSITQHESRFTKHFAELGYRHAVSFPHEEYTSVHPVFENAQLLLEQGCPILKRRMFFHDPLYLDREAIIVRWIVREAVAEGYPEELIWRNVARSAQPRVLNTNASMLEILPDVDVSYDHDRPLRTAAIVHVFYEDMAQELLERLDALPSAFDLYMTTTDEAKRDVILAVLEEHRPEHLEHVEVRILDSNRGRDLSACFVACRDVLTSGEYELIVKVHSKKTVQNGYGPGNFFKLQQLDNLLRGRGYTSNLLALFQREPGLGLVFPPMVHTGAPTMGRGWFTNYEPSWKVLQELGISANLDDVSPLAPYGAMWIFRPEALLGMTEREWRYDEYAPPTHHGDGSLAHVQERIPTYVAAAAGYHARTVANTDYAAVSHTFLEYKLQDLAQHLPGDAMQQSWHLAAITSGPEAPPLVKLKQRAQTRVPGLVPALRPVYGVLRSGYRAIRRRKGNP